jgi:RNA-binding protein
MKLTEKQRRHLRGLAHALKPIILIGNAGVSEGVLAETQRALHDHELIKVRLPGLPRDERDLALADLAKRCDAVLVNRIGHIAILYRPRADLARIVLPAAN